MEEEIQNGDCHLSPMQAVLLETLEIFIRFCTENNITYYLSGGTALGAVRHQGFIPWDDDIDVYMKRPDYERLLSLKKRFLKLIVKYLLMKILLIPIHLLSFSVRNSRYGSSKQQKY